MRIGDVELTRRLDEVVLRMPDGPLVIELYYWGIVDNHYEHPLHKHSFYEAVYITEGTGFYYEEDRVYQLAAGDFFLSRMQLEHRIQGTDSISMIFVGYRIDEEKSDKTAIEAYGVLNAKFSPCVHLNQQHPTFQFWQLLFQQARYDAPLIEAVLSNLAYALILSFATSTMGMNEIVRGSSGFSEILLREAQYYIRDNLKQNPKLTDVANYLHISSRHLTRLFSEQLNVTFSDYVRDKKVGEASQLLRDSNMPIKEIAEHVGFATVHHFAHVFKRSTGQTPAAFRSIERRNG